MEGDPDGCPDIPRHRRPTNEATQDAGGAQHCCCGDDCRTHGLRDDLLTGLEKDVRNAARVGQALLIRHESYIADAEAERARMGAHISSLEDSNSQLETQNALLQDENNMLKDQVDDVNKAVAEAEGHVKSLDVTLQSTRRELDRVNRVAKRTEDLEIQLLDCERQQAELQATLSTTVEEERITSQKWRASERRIAQLEQELEAIEQEAKSERTQHEETVMRLGRRKAVEDGLERQNIDLSAPTDHERRGSEVVSSFVKEILQDNANMQLAMSELREMLAFYKDAHQSPLDLELPQAKRQVSLGEELGMTEQQRQELHVHHHYHGPQQRERSRPPVTMRPKRRRPVIMSGRSSGRSTPNDFSSEYTRPSYRHNPASSQSSNLSTESRPYQNNRWSAQSFQTQSSSGFSDPNSPQSTTYAPSTIFERAFSIDGTEYSQPTTPEWSPVMRPKAIAASSEDDVFQSLSLPPHTSIDSALQSSQETILPPPTTTFNPDTIREAPRSPSPKSRRPLRRTDSHASLLSVSGMDIHTSFESASPTFLQPSRQQSGPILTTMTASAMSRSHGTAQSGYSLKGLAPVPEGTGERYTPLTDTFGNFKRVGGWLSGRFGGGSTADLRGRAGKDAATANLPGSKLNASEAPSKVDDDTASLQSARTTSAGDSTPKAKTPKPVHRPSGINQLGGLPPLPQPQRAWMRGKLDEDALKEALDE